MHFHQKIYKYLLKYRNEYNSNFNFIVRQRASTNDKKYPGGKFAHGFVFQGTEKYCFIALVDRSGGANATKSVGVVVSRTKNNNFKAVLEIVFPGETDLALVDFYKNLAAKFENIIWKSKRERAYLDIGEFPEDDPKVLYNWLDVNFPIIRETALQTGIENLMPNDERFNKLQDNLKKRLVSDKKPKNYWVFQGNPNIYDISTALKAGHLKSWKVAAHKDKIKIGDQIILWQTGRKSGCYALAEVTSEVKIFEEEINEQQYYTEASTANAAERVQIKIIKNLVEHPILWQDIKENTTFLNFKGGNQGTNFSATEEEYNALLNWNQSNDTSYWLYAPGRDALHWDAFYANGIMGLGWDKLGDIKQYKSKDEIRDVLNQVNGDNNPKPNNVAANYEFANTMQIGDVIIAKKGRGKLLGYGIVTSDYYYDESRETYRSCRKVDWKLKGVWESGHSLVLKTLTDITVYNSEYDGYDKYSDYLLGIMNSDNKLNLKSTIKEIMKPTNQILYGPPGTGKTYFLKKQLFEKYTSKQTSISIEQHFESVVSGCSWWQVTAIALLDLKKGKVSDIFEHKWVQKKAHLSNSKTIRPTLWGQLQSHTIQECEYVNVSSRQQPLIFNKTKDSYWEILEEEVKELAPELFDLIDKVENYNPSPNNIIKNYDFVTFHQSFAYEDFIEGIKPIMPENEDETKDLGYRIEDGVFKNLCAKAKNDPKNKYAIFIDEINRGNVSAIFGELITLIEIDKRAGAKNELSIKLPYSKKEFSVPSNLDIYGTMNTADRSVEALDTALRRRFEFKEMMPDYTVVENEEVSGLQLSEVLKTINDRIELLIDRDHTIGHSYFFNVNSEEALANAFNNKIVPLLQEYFYGDYGKIGLVLGKGFIEKQKNDKVNFADFTYENANDFKTPSFVLKKVNKEHIIEAVSILLGKNKEA
jgi:hypothetical protein